MVRRPPLDADNIIISLFEYLSHIYHILRCFLFLNSLTCECVVSLDSSSTKGLIAFTNHSSSSDVTDWPCCISFVLICYNRRPNQVAPRMLRDFVSAGEIPCG